MILTFFQFLIFVKCDELLVITSGGMLLGREFKSRNGRVVAAFSGIPFAKPPIGFLRFQDPQPPEPWSGVRDANNYGSVCVQLTYLYPPVETTMMGHEDCLYLSVYTPKLNPARLLPVMVYFHGGGFAEGSGEVDRSPEFFLDHDVVMVMPNYRLGPLGFLSMEDAILAGNMGLKDQVMALVWVHNNIANFGGDPGQVTLIGESAGGASVHYHMYSPMSRGYALSPWASTAPGVARRRAVKVAQLLQCPIDCSKVIADCLRTKNSYEITKLYRNFTVFQNDPLVVFVPVIDANASNPFLSFDPHQSEAAPVPWLTGVVSLEGIFRTAAFIRQEGSLDVFEQNFYQLVPVAMMYEDTAQNPNEITNKLKAFYFNNQTITNLLFKNLTDMFSDIFFLWPMIKSLQLHKGPQYVFYFDYLGQTSGQEVLATRRVLRGATHSDETIYIWKNNNPFSVQPPTTRTDLRLSHLFVNLLVNFATYGEPTPKGSEFSWPLWENQEQKFISFENQGVVQDHSFLEDRMKFWARLNVRNKVDRCA
ncbi:juvenile hormone esterase-like isoform X2 [Rhodnius prolixus]|uniref:juvenile hormone esterase-like isoform X2 n=1 Tax=Rhodnius prolixus TaxID=13249 RepID=UPI003D1895C4